jgi:hypothetical protein
MQVNPQNRQMGAAIAQQTVETSTDITGTPRYQSKDTERRTIPLRMTPWAANRDLLHRQPALVFCSADHMCDAARNMDDPHDKPTEIACVKIAGRRARRTVVAGGERRPDSGIFQPSLDPDGGRR